MKTTRKYISFSNSVFAMIFCELQNNNWVISPFSYDELPLNHQSELDKEMYEDELHNIDSDPNGSFADNFAVWLNNSVHDAEGRVDIIKLIEDFQYTAKTIKGMAKEFIVHLLDRYVSGYVCYEIKGYKNGKDFRPFDFSANGDFSMFADIDAGWRITSNK